MKRLVLLPIFFISPAQADECDAAIAEIINTTPAKIVGRQKASIDFASGPYRIELSCGKDNFATLFSPNKTPDRDFFYLVGRVGGALSHEDWYDLEKVAMNCETAALRDKSGYVQLNAEKTVLFCTDGGPENMPLIITVQSRERHKDVQ